MNTPNHLTDAQINALVDSGRLPERVIDLRRRYDFEYHENLARPRCERWECRDLVSYDYDPSARMHLVGLGATPNEAQLDLLEQIAERAVQ